MVSAAGLLLVTLGFGQAENLLPPKMVVLDLEAKDVTESEAVLVSGSVCTALSKQDGFSVLCGEDVRVMVQFASLSSSLRGCSDEDCFRSVAEALDARFQVSGRVSRVEDRYVLHLLMLDGSAGTVAGRAEVESPSLDRLQADVPEAVEVLLAGTSSRSSRKKGG